MTISVLDIMKEVRETLEKSAYLQMKEANSPAALEILSANIAEHIKANYHLQKKNAWHGVDLDAKIAEIKQELVIACKLRKKFGKTTPTKPEDKQLKFL